MGMDSRRRNFHGHAQILHVGVSLYNIVEGNLLISPGTKSALPVGDFYMWTGLQGSEDVGVIIITSDADMDALDRRNTQADHIFRVVRMVLQIIVGPLTLQREVIN